MKKSDLLFAQIKNANPEGDSGLTDIKRIEAGKRFELALLASRYNDSRSMQFTRQNFEKAYEEYPEVGAEFRSENDIKVLWRTNNRVRAGLRFLPENGKKCILNMLPVEIIDKILEMAIGQEDSLTLESVIQTSSYFFSKYSTLFNNKRVVLEDNVSRKDLKTVHQNLVMENYGVLPHIYEGEFFYRDGKLLVLTNKNQLLPDEVTYQGINFRFVFKPVGDGHPRLFVEAMSQMTFYGPNHESYIYSNVIPTIEKTIIVKL